LGQARIQVHRKGGDFSIHSFLQAVAQPIISILGRDALFRVGSGQPVGAYTNPATRQARKSVPWPDLRERLNAGQAGVPLLTHTDLTYTGQPVPMNLRGASWKSLG
jgi:hypothetical protein